MVISLFEEMNCTHRHVECKEDVDRELFELFLSAKDLYLKEVVGNKMRPERFIEMFVHSHYYIDCSLARCRNSHQMNLGIIKHLFTDEHSVAVILQKIDYTKHDFNDLLQMCLTMSESYKTRKTDRLSFGCDLTERQLEVLEGIVRKFDIFQIPSDESLTDILRSLFDCKVNVGIKVNSIRNAVVMFDAMLECRLINHNWQSVIENGRMLVNIKTGKYLTVSSLSSSLCKAKRDNMTATQYNIRHAVSELLKLD